MSTSFVYHALGLTGYQFLKVLFEKGKIYLHVRKHPGKLRCPECNSYKIILKGKVTSSSIPN